MNDLYHQNTFQLFILYGRRRVGKTTLLGEFCKDKDTIFFAAEQDSEKGNLDKFSALIFAHYGETTLSPFSGWDNAISFIHERQGEKPLVLVFDEFPYLAKSNKKILSNLQHLIDHKLQYGKLFIILCGSYMSFMEKEVLGEKSPIFGRRTAQLKLKPFPYYTATEFVSGCSNEKKCEYYGAVGGTAQYLGRLQSNASFEKNIRSLFLNTTGYLYEEPRLLLRQEIQEPAIYNAIIEAIASGASKSNEIATKTGEEQAKCLKYIQTLCDLDILYKETPFGEKDSSRKTIYGISDFMFRFWYKYVFNNRSLLYDSFYKTGNSTLDTVLTMKGMVCEKKGIKFTCLIEGKNFNFMSDTDIYSFFGNLIDNCIEAVEPLSEDKKAIALTVNVKEKFLFIRTENYYHGEKNFVGGLPETTKVDRRYHGYGMKSIKNIIEKYNGDLMINTKNDIFSCSIMFCIN